MPYTLTAGSQTQSSLTHPEDREGSYKRYLTATPPDPLQTPRQKHPR